MEQHLVSILLYLSAITSWNANSHLYARSGSTPIQNTIQDRATNAPNFIHVLAIDTHIHTNMPLQLKFNSEN